MIYVHGPMGASLLRICQLPTPIPDPKTGKDGFPILLDINHMYGVSWSAKKVLNKET